MHHCAVNQMLQSRAITVRCDLSVAAGDRQAHYCAGEPWAHDDAAAARPLFNELDTGALSLLATRH